MPIRAPGGAQTGRPGACCPHAAPATRQRLPATFKPGQDTSPELPPQRSESLLPLPALECLSHPAVPTTQWTPDVPDPQDPPPLCSATPFSQRLRPTPPPSARRVPRSLCLETHPGPCAPCWPPRPSAGALQQRPRPRPLTALDSNHGRPLTGLPGLCTGPRHSQQRPLPAVAPRPPRCSALPSLPRRPAWGSLGPRPRPSHETRDRTPPQMLCVQPVDFGTCLPPGLQARQGLAGSLWSPCAPRTQSSVR